MTFESELITDVLSEPGSMWFPEAVSLLAGKVIPHDFLGRRREAITGDVNAQWIRWFVESFYDPKKPCSPTRGYPYLFKQVLQGIELLFGESRTGPERVDIASAIARALFKMVQVNSKRESFSLEQRRLLIDLSGSHPHCYICGANFSEAAIDGFLTSRKIELPKPKFIDILKPRGLINRDINIEIDHILPLSRGGDDGENLQISCGWCNRNKSDRMTLYEVSSQPIAANSNAFGISSLPQPFWIVRLLALTSRCEHPAGCDRTTKDHELTIVWNRPEGSLNPINIRCVCSDHDPIKNVRLQPPSVVKKLWRK